MREAARIILMLGLSTLIAFALRPIPLRFGIAFMLWWIVICPWAVLRMIPIQKPSEPEKEEL